MWYVIWVAGMHSTFAAMGHISYTNLSLMEVPFTEESLNKIFLRLLLCHHVASLDHIVLKVY